MKQEAKPSSALAITSLVLGIVSILWLGILAGIPAIITRHIARGRARKSPGLYGNAGFGLAGIILGYVSAVETIVVRLAMLLPMMGAMGAARPKAQEIACANNLKQISLAAQMYVMDNKDQFPKAVEPLAKYLMRSAVLVCPSDPALKAESVDPKDFSKTSFVVTLEGASATNRTMVIIRCPRHTSMVTADGAVHQGSR
jgi:hypothetical protein